MRLGDQYIKYVPYVGVYENSKDYISGGHLGGANGLFMLKNTLFWPFFVLFNFDPKVTFSNTISYFVINISNSCNE